MFWNGVCALKLGDTARSIHAFRGMLRNSESDYQLAALCGLVESQQVQQQQSRIKKLTKSGTAGHLIRAACYFWRIEPENAFYWPSPAGSITVVSTECHAEATLCLPQVPNSNLKRKH